MRKSSFTQSARAARKAALLIGAPVLLSLQACTDLGETPISAITPEQFYQNEQEIIGGLASVYAQLRNTLWGYYNLSEISTDEMIVPTRGGDWFDNGRWLEIHRQAWSPTSGSALDDMNGTWNDIFTGIARANVLLGALPNVAVANKAVVEAEVRTLRAFYYYLLMDMFGGVPIVETSEIAQRPRNTRAEVFQFIESELQAARQTLPAQWPAESNGRLTRGAADAILASMYLNAEVFTGTVTASGLQRGPARWQDAVTVADRILNSGVYSLATNWHANFRHDNHLSPENILVVKHLNQTGLGFEMVYRPLHYNSGAGGGWNGFSTLAETYYAFDTLRIETVQVPGTSRTANLLVSRDIRHDIFLDGFARNVETGAAINDRSGTPLFFEPNIRDATQASEGEGVRIYKWPVDPNRAGTHHSNDYAYFRLAEIYLIKAEALNELGQTAQAIQIVNMLRARVLEPDQPLPTSLNQASARQAIVRERLMELTAEAKRRQDLIRHGRYTQPWAFKEQREPYRILMPIPQTQIDANPMLEQNPGY